MNAFTTTLPDEPALGEVQIYRAMCKSAVLSFGLSILSFAALLFAPLLVLPLLGFLLGWFALRSIRRYPDELSGKVMALIGSGLSGLLFVVGVATHSLAYATEVPEGYQRITYADLQPVPEHPEMPVPPAALELNGKKVFVKGYLYPDGQQYNIRRFVLVPDMGTCCFGGQPKLTDMIEVTLQDPLRTEYARRKRKLAGVLKVDTRLKAVSGLTGVYYQLTADYLQ